MYNIKNKALPESIVKLFETKGTILQESYEGTHILNLFNQGQSMAELASALEGQPFGRLFQQRPRTALLMTISKTNFPP